MVSDDFCNSEPPSYGTAECWGFGCAEPDLPGVYGRIAADPMRSAIANGIQSVAGVDVLGSGGVPPAGEPPPPGTDPGTLIPDPVAPDTSATRSRSAEKVKKAKKKVRKAKQKVEEVC